MDFDHMHTVKTDLIKDTMWTGLETLTLFTQPIDAELRKELEAMKVEADRLKQFQVYESNKHVTAYKLGNLLGKGSFGEVYQAKHLDTGLQVAIKTVQDRNFAWSLREAQTMKYLKHPGIVRLFDVDYYKGNLYFVQEFISGMDGMAFMKKMKQPFSEDACRAIIRQLLVSLHYMHVKGFAHRDLKSENIMISCDHSEYPECLSKSWKPKSSDELIQILRSIRVKMIDLGLTEKMDSKRCIENIEAGTPVTTAPEVLEMIVAKDPSIFRIKGEPADVWSVGIITYELLSEGGNPLPFYDPRDADIYDKIKRVLESKKIQNSNNVSDSAWSVVSTICNFDPSKRPVIPVLLQHPWFKKISMLTDSAAVKVVSAIPSKQPLVNSKAAPTTPIASLSLAETNKTADIVSVLPRVVQESGWYDERNLISQLTTEEEMMLMRMIVNDMSRATTLTAEQIGHCLFISKDHHVKANLLLHLQSFLGDIHVPLVGKASEFLDMVKSMKKRIGVMYRDFDDILHVAESMGDSYQFFPLDGKIPADLKIKNLSKFTQMFQQGNVTVQLKIDAPYVPPLVFKQTAIKQDIIVANDSPVQLEQVVSYGATAVRVEVEEAEPVADAVAIVSPLLDVQIAETREITPVIVCTPLLSPPSTPAIVQAVAASVNVPVTRGSAKRPAHSDTRSVTPVMYTPLSNVRKITRQPASVVKAVAPAVMSKVGKQVPSSGKENKVQPIKVTAVKVELMKKPAVPKFGATGSGKTTVSPPTAAYSGQPIKKVLVPPVVLKPVTMQKSLVSKQATVKKTVKPAGPVLPSVGTRPIKPEIKLPKIVVVPKPEVKIAYMTKTIAAPLVKDQATKPVVRPPFRF